MSAGRCVHFNGIANDVCEAGVKYTDVRARADVSRPYSLPCLEKYNKDGAKCDKCQMPTAEEVATEEAEWQKVFAGTQTARKAIVDHLGGPWKKGMPTVRGCIDCPVCHKPDALRFSRAGYNGHIHAHCDTKDCVSWME
jgi:hypothetical protein